MKLSCFLPLGYAFAGQDLLWVPAQYEPGFVDTPSIQGVISGQARTIPSAVFHGRLVDLPPYSDPIILPQRGTYEPSEDPTVQSVAPFSDWEYVEYLAPVGYVYKRRVDGLEFVINKDSTSPVIRREGISLQEAYQLANLKEEKAQKENDDLQLLEVAPDAPLYDALPTNLASAVRAVCDGQFGMGVPSVNPLCVGADLWRTLANVEDSDGAIEILEVVDNFPVAAERYAPVESRATIGLLRTIGKLLYTPLQVLGGVYNGVSSASEALTSDPRIRDRARRFGLEGRVLGVIASAVESSGIFALLDNKLANVTASRDAADQYMIPLRVLRSWAETIDRAIIDVNHRAGQLAARGLLIGPKTVFTRPLHYLRTQVRRLVLRTPVVVDFAESIAPRFTNPIAETVASHFGVNPRRPIIAENTEPEETAPEPVEYGVRVGPATPVEVDAPLRNLFGSEDDYAWLVSYMNRDEPEYDEADAIETADEQLEGMTSGVFTRASRGAELAYNAFENHMVIKVATLKGLSAALASAVQTLRNLPLEISKIAVADQAKLRSIPDSTIRRSPFYPKVFIQAITGGLLSLLPEHILSVNTSGRMSDNVVSQLLGLPGSILSPVLNHFSGFGLANGLTNSITESAAGTLSAATNDLFNLVSNLF